MHMLEGLVPVQSSCTVRLTQKVLVEFLHVDVYFFLHVLLLYPQKRDYIRPFW